MNGWLKTGWFWLLLQVSRRMWFRATSFALVSVLGALVAPLIVPLLPGGLIEWFGDGSVGDILRILASSMLVVATFSLGTLISAFSVASSSTTPRVAELLMQDAGAQSAISVFVGAFLFALVGIIGLNAGFYSQGGEVVLFFITVGVVVIVVATFLRWVDLLSHLGRVPDAIDRAAAAAARSLEDRRRAPWLGGRCAVDRSPADAARTEAAGSDAASPTVAVFGSEPGYLRHVDMSVLQQIAEENDCELQLEVLPGAFVDPSRALATIPAELSRDCRDAIRDAFEIGVRRTFDLDPRYGVLTLAEIGTKALSPGINDSGTAISVIAALTRVLAIRAREEAKPEVSCSRVRVPSLRDEDLLEDAFATLARDGAGQVEICIRMQKALASLAGLGAPSLTRAARIQSARALAHARAALTLPEDIERVTLLAEAVGARSPAGSA